MDVESNGVAISPIGANISIANQFLLTTRALIANAKAFGLRATSSRTSFPWLGLPLKYHLMP